MNRSRIPSPARSLGVISTPRKHTPRRSRSVCSTKSNVSVRLTKIISDSFHLSPMPNRRSVLNDDTDIEIPGRKSWWKKLEDNSRDMIDLLDCKDTADVNNVAEEFDVEILSQEKKNYSLDLPESSDGESINSIVIPQRKLFTQKENQAQKKFEHIIDNRETLAKLQKSHFDQEKDINVGPKNLFNKAPKTKPAFPAALLNISLKAVNKTKEMSAPEVKGQVRNLFGNRPGMKRKNLFADFIVSESEDEIPDIQPKVFGFQKNAQKRRESSGSRGVGHSPTSSMDLDLDDWKHLPSSTILENQLEEATTPVKRARLSKLSEAKESETININSTVNKTRQSNKSASSKNKSKASTSKVKDKEDEELLSASKTKEDLLKSKNNLSLNTSSNVRMTRNKSKSMIESPLRVEHTKLHNKSKNKSQSHLSTPIEVQEEDKNTENNEISMKTGLNQQDVEKQIENVSTADVPEEDDEDFTLEYDNDDEQVNEPLAADNIENKSSKNINLVDASEITASKKGAIDIDSEEKNKTQSNKDELDDANFEKQKADNKQQDFKTSLIKDCDIQNKSAVKEKEINRSQSKGKQKQSLSDSQNNSRKPQNVTVVEVHQKTKNESRIEKDKIDTDKENVTDDIGNTDEGENVNESTQHSESKQSNDGTKTNDENDSQNETNEPDEENEQQNESQQLGIENEEQNESTQSNDENKIRNKSKESEAEIKEQNESTQSRHEHEQQNESSQSNNDIQNECIHSDVENESEREQEDNHENVDETVVEAEEEENEQDESEDEQETEEQMQQDESEAEQETEEQHESENINSDNQEQNDDEDEEEYESDVEEQNETENQESENYDSGEEEEQVESDQEESEDVPENELIETFNHDAMLKNKKKDPTIVKSPEVILQDKTNQMESFTAEGRNTSIRKTKSVIKNLTIKPSLAPGRESIGFSDGTRDSSAEGSGWDSHRTTRKTIRLTLGKDFTPRKSLRALVMEKSAKRHTNINEVTTKIPLANSTERIDANSTELPAFDSYEDASEMNEMVEEPSDHEISARTRQTALENYLQKIKQENLEKKRKMEEEIRASLKAPTRDIFNPFKIPLKPVRRIKPVQNKPKSKQTKPSVIPLNMLPSEVLEDMKYKPPKRFQPSNASWITKRLYNFLENKLEPKYDYKARIRAERLVELLYGFTREVKRGPNEQAVDTLKREMARLEIVKTHFDFYEFFHEFMPREIRVMVVPDVVNKISLPRGGVFSDILQ